MKPFLAAAFGAGVLLAAPDLGAEDFAFIAERVPSLYIQIGERDPAVARADAADHHTPGFMIDDRGLALGVRALTAMTLWYLEGRP